MATVAVHRRERPEALFLRVPRRTTLRKDGNNGCPVAHWAQVLGLWGAGGGVKGPRGPGAADPPGLGVSIATGDRRVSLDDVPTCV